MFIKCNDSLGWREAYRLAQFLERIIDEHFEDCHDAKIGYDLHEDEPYIVLDSENFQQRLYASDYDYAFNAHNEICNI